MNLQKCWNWAYAMLEKYSILVGDCPLRSSAALHSNPVLPSCTVSGDTRLWKFNCGRQNMHRTMLLKYDGDVAMLHAWRSCSAIVGPIRLYH